MKKQSEHSDRHLAIADTGAVVPDLISEVQDKIIRIRDCAVIVDADVASLYGVGTKHVNQAVRNNPDKFPADSLQIATKEDVAAMCAGQSSIMEKIDGIDHRVAEGIEATRQTSGRVYRVRGIGSKFPASLRIPRPSIFPNRGVPQFV